MLFNDIERQEYLLKDKKLINGGCQMKNLFLKVALLLTVGIGLLSGCEKVSSSDVRKGELYPFFTVTQKEGEAKVNAVVTILIKDQIGKSVDLNDGETLYCNNTTLLRNQTFYNYVTYEAKIDKADEYVFTMKKINNNDKNKLRFEKSIKVPVFSFNNFNFPNSIKSGEDLKVTWNNPELVEATEIQFYHNFSEKYEKDYYSKSVGIKGELIISNKQIKELLSELTQKSNYDFYVNPISIKNYKKIDIDDDYFKYGMMEAIYYFNQKPTAIPYTQ